MLSHFWGGSLLCEQTAHTHKVFRILEADKPSRGIPVKELEKVCKPVAVGIVPVLIDFVDNFPTLLDNDSVDGFVVTDVVGFFRVVQDTFHITAYQ